MNEVVQLMTLEVKQIIVSTLV